MSGLLVDLRYTLRGLVRAPGMAAIAVVTIALGVGANSALFSVVDAVLLRPLPFPESDRLAALWPEKRWSIQMLEDVRERINAYQATAAYSSATLTLYGGAVPEAIDVTTATHDYFDVLRVSPILGRSFTPEDAAAQNGHVVIISHGLWQRLYGGDPDVIGRTVELAGLGAPQRAIIGVAPEGFTGLHAKAQAWVPVITQSGVPGYAGQYGFNVVGRLRAGVAATAASSELRSLVPDMTPVHPTQFREIRYSPIDVVPLLDQIVSKVRAKLLVLLGVVGFILLIACSNVANLLLARSASRQRNVALQVAIGAGRARIIRQTLMESVTLSLSGGVLGTAAAYAALPLLRTYVASQLPRTAGIVMDLRVLLFSLGVAIAAGLLFGVLPAVRALHVAPTGMLRESSRAQSPGRRNSRINDVLVASEVALSLVLLTGAGLMLKTLTRLSAVDLGFRADNVMTMEVSLPPVKYATADTREAFARDALGRVAAMPGVTSVGSTNILPLSTQGLALPYQILGEPAPEGSAYQVVSTRSITPEYFEVLGIPLLQGRMITAADSAALIANAAFAAKHWPGQDPLGYTILTPGGDTLGVIVGIVGDVRQMAVAEPPAPEIYGHTGVFGWNLGTLAIRFSGTPPSHSVIVDALREIEPDLTVRNATTMEALVHEALGSTRFFARLFGGFSILALVLALIGVYGVMSYAMTLRFREFGIRMALGATQSTVLRVAVASAMIPVAIGTALGVIGALFGSRLLAAMLYEVRPTDPVVIATVALLMMATAAVGALIPALRAVRLNPVHALRSD